MCNRMLFSQKVNILFSHPNETGLRKHHYNYFVLTAKLMKTLFQRCVTVCNCMNYVRWSECAQSLPILMRRRVIPTKDVGNITIAISKECNVDGTLFRRSVTILAHWPSLWSESGHSLPILMGRRGESDHIGV